MRKRSLALVVALMLVVLIIPFPASAKGGYVASRGSNVYHTPDCYHVRSISSSNLIWWHTQTEAEATGRRPCHDCMPHRYGTKFSHGTTHKWTSESPLLQLAFEEEYSGGYTDGYRTGYEEGKNEWYAEGKRDGESEGFEIGKAEGYEDGVEAGKIEGYKLAESEHNQKLSSEIDAATSTAYKLSAILGLPLTLIACVSAYCAGTNKRKEDISEVAHRSQKQAIVAAEAIQIPMTKPHTPDREFLIGTGRADRITVQSEFSKNAPKPPRLGPADEEFTVVKRSSFISAVCYKNERLYVKTAQGDCFVYYNVPRPVYLDFMNAPSMGKFFNQRIANNYPFSRL